MSKRLNSTTSFLDLLFNSILVFFVLLVLTITLVNPPTKIGDIPLKAEVLITMEWPDESKDDVDLVVKTPASKRPIFFGNRDIKTASLDRDDLGLRSDTIKMSDGTIHRIYENWEHVAIRKFIPGDYVVNALMYRKIDAEPTEVSIKVERLNPYYLIYSGTLMLSGDKEEKTAVRFKIDKTGKLLQRDSVQQSLKQLLNLNGGNP